jgi:hypothetical protein
MKKPPQVRSKQGRPFSLDDARQTGQEGDFALLSRRHGSEPLKLVPAASSWPTTHDELSGPIPGRPDIRVECFREQDQHRKRERATYIDVRFFGERYSGIASPAEFQGMQWTLNSNFQFGRNPHSDLPTDNIFPGRLSLQHFSQALWLHGFLGWFGKIPRKIGASPPIYDA